jgi:hypothetical protein
MISVTSFRAKKGLCSIQSGWAQGLQSSSRTTQVTSMQQEGLPLKGTVSWQLGPSWLLIGMGSEG